jgi:HPt (histidine-containing phosphotransfer) domain-containing protein
VDNGEILIDRDQGLRNVDGDEEFFREILEIYREEIPERIESFQKHLEKNDFTTIISLAHSLKGVSLTVGALRVHELSKNIELAARAGEEETVRTLYPELEDLLRKIENECT